MVRGCFCLLSKTKKSPNNNSNNNFSFNCSLDASCATTPVSYVYYNDICTSGSSYSCFGNVVSTCSYGYLTCDLCQAQYTMVPATCTLSKGLLYEWSLGKYAKGSCSAPTVLNNTKGIGLVTYNYLSADCKTLHTHRVFQPYQCTLTGGKWTLTYCDKQYQRSMPCTDSTCNTCDNNLETKTELDTTCKAGSQTFCIGYAAAPSVHMTNWMLYAITTAIAALLIGW